MKKFILTASSAIILASCSSVTKETSSNTREVASAPMPVTYCMAGSNQSWRNCLEGSAKNNDLSRIGSVVLSGIQLPTTFQYVLSDDHSVSLISDGQKIEIATLKGEPNVVPDIRYDQELAPVQGLEISQTKKMGAITSSCYHNALNVCMKNSNQAMELTTTIKVNNWSASKTESTSEPRGEVLGFFCCK
ncbi:MAG: lipoprotein [Bacteriovorax sp.]